MYHRGLGTSKSEGKLVVRWALVKEESTAAHQAMRRWSRPCDLSDPARERSRLARALLRLLLAESTGATFGWTFDVEISGRPVACRKSSGRVPSIAISHSGGWVACAVASRGQVGIDIEVHRPGRDIMGIAGLAFGDGERRDVGRGGMAAFYRIWTSREALAKARGRGLVEAADGIDRVAGVTNGLQLRRIGGEEWWLMQATPAQGLALALAFNRGVDGHATARPAGMRLRTAKPSQIDPTGPFTQGIAMTCGLDPIWPSANRAGREL